MDWQPIETAPGNGDLVLVCGKWPDGTGWHSIGQAYEIGVLGDWHESIEPDYWMPLPAPPTDGD